MQRSDPIPFFGVALERVSRMTKREQVRVPNQTVYAALGAMAAAIEEPYCLLGPGELRGLVDAHRRLCAAIGLDVDYRWFGGEVVAARDRLHVIKRPVQGWMTGDDAPIALPDDDEAALKAALDGDGGGRA